MSVYIWKSHVIQFLWQFFAYHFWTPGGNRKGLIKQGLSVLSSVLLSRRFLRIVSLFFSEFWRVARNPYEVVRDRNGFSGKKFFAQKFGKMDQKWAKNRVLNLLKDLVINFYWICSVMKTYICCAPAQIPYLGKILFWDMGQNILSKWDCMVF